MDEILRAEALAIDRAGAIGERPATKAPLQRATVSCRKVVRTKRRMEHAPRGLVAKSHK